MYSSFSEANSLVQPGTKIVSSQDVNWTSLLFESWLQPGHVETFETVASPDQTIVVTAAGTYDIEVFARGQWRSAQYGPGRGGATAPLNTNRIRWRSSEKALLRTLHVYVPAEYFDEAKEEYRRAGKEAKVLHMDALSLSDPLIFSTAQALEASVALEAPNLYADAASRLLATHILLLNGNLRPEDFRREPHSELSDRRLTRVIEFMQHNYSGDITLDRLAGEAGISRFHFVRLFQKRLRTTPHQFLVQLRLNQAKELLRTTDLDIRAIASACGYKHPGRFAAAFSKAFSISPSLFRERLRANVIQPRPGR